jgi:uncharacterized membrane protein
MAVAATSGATFGHRPGSGTENVLVNAKKLIVLVVVAFVLFFLITQPSESANVVDTVLNWLKTAAESIITFVRNLFA